MKPIVIMFIAVVVLVTISPFAARHCESSLKPPVSKGSDAWYVEGPTCRSAWWKVRVLMGKQKAYGVNVLDETKDKNGYHLFVQLQIIK